MSKKLKCPKNEIIKRFLISTMLLIVANMNAQIIEFKDNAFKNKLVDPLNFVAKNLKGELFKIDQNNNGEIEYSEALQVSFIYVTRSKIQDLTGIEYFKNLTELHCDDNNISLLDVSKNTELVSLSCHRNPLFVLNVTQNKKLKTLICVWNYLTALDVTNNVLLEELQCGGNEIKKIDLSKNQALTSLDCRSNIFTSLDLQFNVNLKKLVCSNNRLEELNVSKNTKLEILECNNTQIISLDLSKNNVLKHARFGDNDRLKFLNLQNFTNEGIDGAGANYISHICADKNEIDYIKGVYSRYATSKTLTIDSSCSEGQCNDISNYRTFSMCKLFEPKVKNLNGFVEKSDIKWKLSSNNESLTEDTPLIDGATYYGSIQYGCDTVKYNVLVTIQNPYIQPIKPIYWSYEKGTRVAVGDLQKIGYPFYGFYLTPKGGTLLDSSFVISENITLYNGFDGANSGECYEYNRTPVYISFTDALSTDNFEFNRELTMFPNPVQDILTITPKDGTKIQLVEIYNLQGLLITTALSQVAQTGIEVSSLSKGMYVIKVQTEKGNTTSKFLKN